MGNAGLRAGQGIDINQASPVEAGHGVRRPDAAVALTARQAACLDAIDGGEYDDMPYLPITVHEGCQLVADGLASVGSGTHLITSTDAGRLALAAHRLASGVRFSATIDTEGNS